METSVRLLATESVKKLYFYKNNAFTNCTESAKDNFLNRCISNIYHSLHATASQIKYIKIKLALGLVQWW